MAHSVEHLTLGFGSGHDPGSWDQPLCQAPCLAGILLLPLSLPISPAHALFSCSLSVSLSQRNKILKKKKKVIVGHLGGNGEQVIGSLCLELRREIWIRIKDLSIVCPGLLVAKAMKLDEILWRKNVK